MERISDSCYGDVPLPLQAMLGMALNTQKSLPVLSATTHLFLSVVSTNGHLTQVENSCPSYVPASRWGFKGL